MSKPWVCAGRPHSSSTVGRSIRSVRPNCARLWPRKWPRAARDRGAHDKEAPTNEQAHHPVAVDPHRTCAHLRCRPCRVGGCDRRGRVGAGLHRRQPAWRGLHDDPQHRRRSRHADRHFHAACHDAGDPREQDQCRRRQFDGACGRDNHRPRRSCGTGARRAARHAHAATGADDRGRQLSADAELLGWRLRCGRSADPRNRGARAGRLMRRRTALGYGAAALGAMGLTLFVGWWRVDGPGAPEAVARLPLPLTEMDFRLTDHEGQPVGPATLVGRPTMVFFGFTFCPDVCPTTLSDISGWLDALDEDAGQMNVVFITVDPERDTVEAMAEYVGYFHPAICGWTGAQNQIARAAEGFRASYERVPTDGGDYTMNHTASVFLFDAAGGLVSTIDYHEPREFAVPKIRRALEEETEGAT